jgi:hypothetical protein
VLEETAVLQQRRFQQTVKQTAAAFLDAAWAAAEPGSAGRQLVARQAAAFLDAVAKEAVLQASLAEES